MLKRSCLWLLLALLATSLPARATDAEDRRIAEHLAALLRAGRAVISANQARINDPALGPKGLDGNFVLAASLAAFQQSTGIDAQALDPGSREGRLLGYEMAAIRTVMDANQGLLNAAGTGFKGFLPAVFARLVGENFSERAHGLAQMRVTAPPELVRNRRALPDAWETETIQDRFLRADWPRGAAFEAGDSAAYRVAVPEYYDGSCLSCHGGPKGETDISGYPKEGRLVGDLGGVISITLLRK